MVKDGLRSNAESDDLMAAGKRVLTVTYGTFSCTLEGFDDAFATMKAITQYFRDLAAEDRQFGGEIAKPNTDALKRIAERELSRGVEASMGETGLVLRPADRIPGDSARDVSALPAEEEPRPRVLRREPGQQPPAPRPEAQPQPEAQGEAKAAAKAPPAAEEKPAAKAAPKPAAVQPGPTQDPSKKLEGLRATASGANISAKFQARSAEVLAKSAEKKREANSGESVADKLSRIRSAVAHTAPGTAQPQRSGVPPITEDEADAATATPVAFASVRQRDMGDAPDEMVEEEAFADDAPDLTAGQHADLDADMAEAAAEEEAAGAAAEEEIAAGDEAEEPVAEIHAEDGAGRRRKGQQLLDNPGEDSVARLVETANTQLQGAENRRRHSAIAHLKAAVAATTADREAGVEEDDGSQALNSYRDALSQIVQPRPGDPAPVARAPEPVAPPPMAPLVLVSSQRIREPERAAPYIPEGFMARPSDGPADDDSGPADGPAPRKPSITFVEFASLSGADDLVDLLEVASAYLTVHEGRSEFSRQLIMQTLGQVADDGEIPREEGIAAFGALLRQGRVVKGRRGLFSLPESSRYAQAGR